jgi:hypothetical protein
MLTINAREACRDILRRHGYTDQPRGEALSPDTMTDEELTDLSQAIIRNGIARPITNPQPWWAPLKMKRPDPDARLVADCVRQHGTTNKAAFAVLAARRKGRS